MRNFFPAALLICVLSGLFYGFESRNSRQALITNEVDHVSSGRLTIERLLVSLGRDTRYAASELSFTTPTIELSAVAEIAHEFSNYLSAKEIYSKVRWIDETGLERVRAEHSKRGTTLQPLDQPANKSDRYYFRHAMKFEKGDIYLSPLDLEIDQGMIEQPHQPVIRAATPVFDLAGRPRGIAMLTYSAQDLFERIDHAIASPRTEWMLLNQDGYWLRSTNPAQAFGFMLPHQRNMAASHPGVWGKISTTENGDYTDSSGNLWIYDTVHPYNTIGTKPPPSNNDSATNIGTWKLVKYIDADTFSSQLEKLRLEVATTCAMVLLLALFTSIRLSRSQLDRGKSQANLQDALSVLGQQKLALEQHETNLEQARSHLQSILDAASEFAIISIDTQGLISSFNRGAELMLGYGTAEVVGISTPLPFHLETELLARGDQLSARYGHPVRGIAVLTENSKHQPSDTHEWTYIRKDGSHLTASVTVTAMRNTAGEVSGFLNIARDITHIKQAEAQLRVAATAFETQDAIMVTDAGANIISVNRAFERITGYSLSEVLGKSPNILKSGRHDAEFYRKLWAALHDTGIWAGEMWDKRKDGLIYPKWITISAVHNEAHQVTHYVAIFTDMTERKRTEEEIHRLAFYDTLTHLPNRRLLLDRLGQSLSLSQRNGYHGALLFMDMDNFKTLNDSKGHEAGDMMLIEVANRLKSCVRDSDTVARLGGDEFVVILQDLASSAMLAANQAEDIAEKILFTLNQPYDLAGLQHFSSVSIGACLFQGADTTAEELLKRADTAMYQAKSAGRNNVRFFEAAMQAAIESHAALEAELRQAITRQELQLYYQMQVDSDRRIHGAEVLLRWPNPERGFVPPGQFIPLAEESRLILPIGHWVLSCAIRQLKKWQGNRRTRHLQLAVNVSAVQFSEPDFVERIEALLQEFAIDPEKLKLELTESVVLKDVEDSIQKMHALQKRGVQFSMDDFGTGYSSLTYLKRLPLNQIKIDQSFVHDIVVDHNDALLVKAIIDMSHNFGLEVIAEGVETAEQLEVLERGGCRSFQGYFFGKPVPLAEFEHLLEKEISEKATP
ncbi:MAG: EAL domain-containing protein [Nitrosomonadales bacterium]|nr:EAL domain-containing protein [Nitrosomonadales bacterium]